MKLDLKKIRIFVQKAHLGQFRRNGEPYYMHLHRVASNFKRIDLKIIALLHDVLEDTELTENDLVKLGLDKQLIFFINILTKSNYSNYEDYLSEIKKYKHTRIVKICDMLDNLCDNPTKKQILKYSKGLQYLLS